AGELAELQLQDRLGRVDQVEALVGRVVDEVVQLRGQRVELRRRCLALRRRLSLGGVQDALQLLQDRNDALRRIDGRGDRGDALVDVVFALREVVRAVGERLALEELDRVVEGARDLEAGGEVVLRRANAGVDVLQRKQVLAGR